jgi:hypothetical protein
MENDGFKGDVGSILKSYDYINEEDQWAKINDRDCRSLWTFEKSQNYCTTGDRATGCSP